MPKSVCILVLGDIGRSPRIQYHALSFAENGFHVDIIGYNETTTFPAIAGNKSITIHGITAFPSPNTFIRKLKPLFIIYALLKLLFQCVAFFYACLKIKTPSIFLVQTPPAIPTLLLVQLYCRITNVKLIIDWHNFGYSLLALNYNQESKIVQIAKWFESFFGKTADLHICVTRAMAEFLKKSSTGRIITLYDRPPDHFKPTSLQDSHQLFLRLSAHNTSISEWIKDDQHSLTTVTQNSSPVYFKDRPVIVVTSTSYTEDEDLDIFINSILEYDKISIENAMPRIFGIITGNGPKRSFYEKKIANTELKNCKIITLWLESSDYPLLLGSADLGISLHKSSSGLDLPMKVVDMLGCQLPFFALHYPCLDELVNDKKIGQTFTCSRELVEKLTWFAKNIFNPMKRANLLDTSQTITNSPLKNTSQSWRENWNKTLLPRVNELVSKHQ